MNKFTDEDECFWLPETSAIIPRHWTHSETVNAVNVSIHRPTTATAGLLYFVRR